MFWFGHQGYGRMGKKQKDQREADEQPGQEDRPRKKAKKEKRHKRQEKAEEVDASAQEAAAKQQPEPEEPAPGAAAETTPADEAQPDGGRNRSRSKVSLVPAETAKYLSEVVEHLRSLVDDEEKQLLLGNVLEEVKGKEAQAAADPICSRHVEALLQAASSQQLLDFMTGVLETGGLAPLAVSPFGSHVAEKVLIRLGDAHDSMSQEEYEAFTKLLQSVVEEMCETLYSYMTDRFATHVARRVLCVLCGSNILSPGSKGPTDNKKPQAEEEGEQDGQQQQRAKQKGAAAAGLAAKLAGSQTGAAELLPCRFPEQTEAVLRVLCREDYGSDSMWELVTGQYASPFIQAALRAATTLPNSRNMLTTLLPAVLGATYIIEGSNKQGKVFEGVSADNVQNMCQDTTASRVLEVVISVSSYVPGCLDEFITRFFAGSAQQLAQHPAANYVVQALLAACSTPAQVTSLFEELKSSISDLLRRRRAGVVAALAAACNRAGCCHKEFCTALSAALTAHSPWSGQPANNVLAAALLCLDSTGAQLCSPDSSSTMPPLSSLVKGGPGFPPPRLSALGGAILISVLKLQQGACRDFTDSLVNMSSADLARVGYDPLGARSLEALLGGSAPAKVKQKVLEGLQGGWAVLASSGSGAFLLEKAYTLAEGDVKEQIVKELAAAEKHLSSLHWGPKLLARVGADTYKKDPAQWRRAAEASTKALAQFTELFGDSPGQPQHKTQAAPTVTARQDQEGNQAQAGGKKKKKKREVLGQVEDEAAAVEAQGQEQQQGEGQGEVMETEEDGGQGKKTSKKKRKAGDEPLVEGHQQGEVDGKSAGGGGGAGEGQPRKGSVVDGTTGPDEIDALFAGLTGKKKRKIKKQV